MKKSLFLSACILLTSLISTANAQYFKAEPLIDRTVYLSAARTMILSESDRAAIVNLRALNAKAGKNFEKSFVNATEIKISTQGKHTFVHFMEDGIKNRVHYNKNGWQQSLIRYYSPAHIPAKVKEVINELYPDYSIFGDIVEVTVKDKTAHLVLIENCNSWKRIKVVDGETEVYEAFKKQ